MQQSFDTATWVLVILPLCSLIVLSGVNYWLSQRKQRKGQR